MCNFEEILNKKKLIKGNFFVFVIMNEFSNIWDYGGMIHLDMYFI